MGLNLVFKGLKVKSMVSFRPLSFIGGERTPPPAAKLKCRIDGPQESDGRRELNRAWQQSKQNHDCQIVQFAAKLYT